MGQNDNLIEDYRNLVTNILLENPTIVEVLSDGKLSLEEADNLVQNTSDEDYAKMISNIAPYQYMLLNGVYTKKLLMDALICVLEK